MSSTPSQFKAAASRALRDPELQSALGRMREGFIAKRSRAVEDLPEYDALREAAREIKDQALRNLDEHLDRFQERVRATGGRVHRCGSAEEAVETVLRICGEADATSVVKSKSMTTEEIGLNERLEARGIEVVETDLGEYAVQLRDEPPSHILAPAIHLSARQVEEAFRARHRGLDAGRALETPSDLVREARHVLRERFLGAEVGITGANFLVAETGTVVLVTNEGNADLARQLPGTHVVIAGIEKAVGTLEETTVLLRLLARNATGQEISTYTTFASGPAFEGQAYHVVLLDNGRSGILGGEFADVLRCIRCSACVNHCPVYGAVGGHAYGSVYSGPIGAVLTPFHTGLEEARHLPEASSFCRRCEEVCPVGIPLVRLMRRWREESVERGIAPAAVRYGLGAWAFVAARPRLYRLLSRIASWVLRLLGGSDGRLSRLPLAGGWTAYRDLPVPDEPPFVGGAGDGR